MQSNVCKIENGIRDLGAILKESEKVAVYNELNEKQTLQLRLICEEIDGMLPKLIDEFEGAFWIDFQDGVCKVNVSIQFNEFTTKKKKDLLSIAKNKKNASVTGIVAKIGAIIEEFFLEPSNVNTLCMMSDSYHWSLNQYRVEVKKEKKAEEWDELEKSVIASIADDIIVGVKGLKADIVVVKKFA